MFCRYKLFIFKIEQISIERNIKYRNLGNNFNLFKIIIHCVKSPILSLSITWLKSTALNTNIISDDKFIKFGL